jgi:hypothetical protein
MQSYQVPGVWVEEHFQTQPQPFLTGIPVFLGLVRHQALVDLPRRIRDEKLARLALSAPELWLLRKPGTSDQATDTRPELFGSWPEFEENFGYLSPYGYLTAAVRGFFENGGDQCYTQVIYFDEAVSIVSALREGLSTLRHFDAADLVCAPDIMHAAMQRSGPPAAPDVRSMQNHILDHCDKMGDRFAILDSLKGADGNEVLAQRQGLSAANGALYFPWLKTLQTGAIPPCGHVAGVFARSDRQTGVHKAPANEALEGVLDLEINVDNAVQEMLNPKGINCLRAFAGRGIRVWGARSLHDAPEWKYVNVRRLFLTVGRWAVRFMTPAAFEPHDSGLWARITRELTAYLTELFRQGAFRGATAQEAFFVKCDAENNPEQVRETGMAIADIGLAVAAPGEFIVVRITHGIAGIDVSVSPLQTRQPLKAAPVFERTLRADVRIAHLEYNPPGPDVPGEYVLIQNSGNNSVDLTGWMLSDIAYHTYRFPSFVLSPNGYVRIWTKQGVDSATDLYWGRRAAIWNNVGDRAFLRDNRGLLVSEFPSVA